MTKVGLLVVLLLVTAVSGCTDGGGEDNFATPPQDDAGRYIIEISDFKFTPAQAKVPVGATVVWMIVGGGHNVAPDGHSEWSATTVSSSTGEHLVHKFSKAGTFDYYCHPHQSMGMKGTIKVA